MTHLAMEPHTGTASLAGRAGAWLRRAWRVWQNRRAVRRLQQLDDRILTDIGLTRGDVDGALSGSLWQDPSLQLHQIVMARRCGRLRI